MSHSARRNITENEYSLVPDVALGRFLDALGAAYTFSEDHSVTIQRSYYDSFDWRLFGGGGRLCLEQNEGRSRLIWSGQDRRHGRIVLNGVTQVPRFVWSFPASGMRSVIAPLLEMRALLPRADVECQVRLVRVLDDERKTVVRIRVEENRIRHPGDDTSVGEPLSTRIEIESVRGYRAQYDALLEWIAGVPYLHSGMPCLLEEGMAALGEPAGSYSAKLRFRFNSQMPAVEALREIHLFLLGVMELNINGVQEDLDSEFLHDFRVAVRRTRSALTQVKKVLPADQVEHFKERFAWLGQVTGPTRDMHVYLLGFDDYRDTLPERYRADLDPLRRFLVEHQRTEHAALAETMKSDEFTALLAQWRAFLTGDLRADDAKAGPWPLVDVASKRIAKMYHRVMEEGGAIGERSPAEDLHELRKSCKKLRYLMEFFQSVYPADQIGGLIKEIKKLLDNLGDFQDLEVQADKLRHFAHLMVEEGNAPADTLLAMGMLVDSLLRRQQEKRAEFTERFAAFAGAGNRKLFESLFEADQGAEK